jgi:ABC-type transport system involved in multi-copper enzyme maturation permease subunit
MATAEVSDTTKHPYQPGRSYSLLRNPVVLKELRGRMRGPRAFVVLTVYLTLMSGFATLLYFLYSSSLNYAGYAVGGTIGRWLFNGVVGVELFLVTFIAPTFTASAISGERERQTYDLLRTTLLPARSLIIGKLLSALSYVLLLLFAAIPLQSIAFLFGGVTELEIILSFIILFVTAIMLGSVGIYCSAAIPRTLTASVVTYGVAVLITLGLPLLIVLVIALLGGVLNDPGTMHTSVQAAFLYIGNILAMTNPLAAAGSTEYLLLNNRGAGLFTWNLVGPNGTLAIPYVSPWIPFVIFYLLVSAVMVLLAIRRVRRIDP